MMKINQLTPEQLVMFRDALGEVHTSLTKVHFLGVKLFGDEFVKLMNANNSLFSQVHEVVKNNEESAKNEAEPFRITPRKDGEYLEPVYVKLTQADIQKGTNDED